jgi:hypothetical protein
MGTDDLQPGATLGAAGALTERWRVDEMDLAGTFRAGTFVHPLFPFRFTPMALIPGAKLPHLCTIRLHQMWQRCRRTPIDVAKPCKGEILGRQSWQAPL